MVCEDKNISGGTPDRPQLQAAIAALKPGMVLVVDTSDRLARDMLVYLTIQQRVREAGARIEFADGTPPTITAEGELIANIFAAFAQYQRTVIRKKTKAGLARKKDRGVYLGKCPIGYSRDKQGKLACHTYEQSVIAEILVRGNRGFSAKEIADSLNANFCTIRGKPWNERTIRRIIKREKDRE
jgi:DNA invertase Pin-like site-specific DNA recombinase